eukprot:gb/GECG01006785.1/.p1 GENE.gb/GECG01006785.1/~~gb/GECG01006785.1/.p1  ORF type:complete len:108 (+),score=13.59 gb/GECG01006785.1/:1-324(+)
MDGSPSQTQQASKRDIDRKLLPSFKIWISIIRKSTCLFQGVSSETCKNFVVSMTAFVTSFTTSRGDLSIGAFPPERRFALQRIQKDGGKILGGTDTGIAAEDRIQSS